ncbi:DNA polymerase [Phage MedPE-SWcel-C56]|uniref:DNA-directed DNA polymerase family A palm domain-containing protein n=1 Tax=Phage MedPE-SWcel-C56 TaxID=1871314 RepID=A0A1B1IY16_9CAUD|nr:DNA polymerase [Phage MedPE-SWcel-C56]ANS06219.1 hypothetical protein [Phage MedPE-SWcel-C56]
MYLIFDEETQIHKSHKRVANQWHPDNYVVMRGWKKQGDKCASWRRFEGKSDDNHLVIDPDVKVLVGHNIKFDMLYEMANCLNPHVIPFFQRGGRIWCTQYAEYLLHAQDRKYHMCSMDDIAESYGGRVKIDQIKALWKAGVQTADIDPDLLADYLVGTEDEGRNSGDIGNTEKIYRGQVKLAKELGMYKAILHRMEGLAATTEMEFNGIKVNRARAAVNQKKLEVKREETAKALEEHVAFIPEEVGFSWGSRVHTSCLIYGGTIRYKKSATYTDEKTGELARFRTKEDWPMFDGEPVAPTDWVNTVVNGSEGWEYRCHLVDGMYHLQFRENGDLVEGDGTKQDTFKGGKRMGEPKFKKMDGWGELKTKIQDFFYELPQITAPDPKWKTKNVDGAGKPLYGTGADIIASLSKRGIPFLENMGKLQALDKEIGTYYMRYDPRKKEHVGMLTCVMDDGIVHHSLNHTSTVTSRLSANNPNAQNFPRGDKSELKAIFVSRFGDDGRMIEADYSQLEVVVQGLLSGDANLCKDLINRVDFHCKRVALKNSVSYDFALLHCKDEDASEDYAKWKKERTKCKIFSFQRAYGAGAALISEETGMDIDEVKDMIVKEDKEYPGIPKFNAAVEAAVHETAEPFRAGQDRGFRVFRRGWWQAPTGTMYTWTSNDAPSFLKRKGIEDTFSPTELKNYPVQGTGGEIVQMIIGRLWRYFMKKNNWDGRALLVNTVHDCIWVDCHKDVLDEVCKVIKVIMESVPKLLKSQFNIDCPVPFPVDVEAGKDMLELHHVDV